MTSSLPEDAWQRTQEHLAQQTLEKCGKIDVLDNNGGLTWGAPAKSMPLERWQQVIDANITGTLLMSQFVGRHSSPVGWLRPV